jgi:hypothetical protein
MKNDRTGNDLLESILMLGECFKHWEEITPKGRKEFCKNFEKALKHIPDEFIDVIPRCFSKWPKSHLEMLFNASTKELAKRRAKAALGVLK